MFTGIVQGLGVIAAADKARGLNNSDTKLTLKISLPENLLIDLEIGASVSVDGVCLTATEIKGSSVSFDLVQETLDRTTFNSINVEDLVNIERSLKFGSEIGGHLVSGHIDTTAQIVEVLTQSNNHIVQFSLPSKYRRYIFEKGYIAINGASLTIASVRDASTIEGSTTTDILEKNYDSTNKFLFSVSLIPETLRLTTFSKKKVGDLVNIEIDRQTQAIVDSVERYLESSKITK